MGITAPERVPTRIDLWVTLAGNPGLISVIDSLVVVGEVAIGVALILGIATRFAGVMDPAAFRLAFRWGVSGRMAGSDPICPALVVELGQAHRSEKNRSVERSAVGGLRGVVIWMGVLVWAIVIGGG